MAFFDDIGRKFGEMTDTSRLNSTINEEERKINANYTQIGKLYVSLHRDNPDPELAVFVQAIAQSEQIIQNSRFQIQKIKGVRTCTNCGGEVSVSSAFCALCGNPMPVENESLKGSFTVCAGCGKVLEEGMRFCINCGRPVSPRTAAPAAPAYTPVPTPQPTPAPVNESAPVSAEPAAPVYAMPAEPVAEAAAAEMPAAEVPESAPETVTPEDEAVTETPAVSEAAPAPEVDAGMAPQRFCPSCGAQIEDGDVFCMNCGARI